MKSEIEAKILELTVRLEDITIPPIGKYGIRANINKLRELLDLLNY